MGSKSELGRQKDVGKGKKRAEVSWEHDIFGGVGGDQGGARRLWDGVLEGPRSAFVVVLGKNIALSSGIVAFSSIEFPCTLEHRF